MNYLCVLCLKATVTRKCAESKLFIELLDIMLLNPWWNISRTPTLCYDCSIKTAKAFGFKANCLYTEDLLAPHIKSRSSTKVDLRTAYLRKKKNEIDTGQAGEFFKICCLCINLINSSHTFIFDLLKEHQFDEKFRKYFPEMDLQHIEDPLICQQCNDNLRDFIEFVTSCIRTNNKISRYREINNIKDGDKIDLQQVLVEFEGSLSPNDEGSNLNYGDLMDTIKEEYVVVDYRSGSVVPLGDHTDIKDEEIDIKSDHLASDCEEKPDKRTKNTNTKKCTKRKSLEKKVFSRKAKQKIDSSKSDEKPFKCKDCHFETADKSRLKKHERRKHPGDDAPKYSCDKCDYQTTDRYYLTRHSLRHKDSSEVQLYKCSKCTYKSRYKDHLRGHYLTHVDKDEVKTFHCDSCNFSSKFKGSLTQHKRTHEKLSQVRTFKCTIGKCTYTTIEKSYLNKHIKRHGKPPKMETLHCMRCDYQTKYKKHLRDHVLVHLGSNKILHCKMCKFKSRWKENLQAHMLKKHG